MDKHEKNEAPHLFIDSKYRKILIAAKRSKPLQKGGASPRLDAQCQDDARRARRGRKRPDRF